ncbi:MAG: flagellar hook-associated protein 3 [Candidatus Auribacter fodinae]|jgi:flagellar hook-associated protein 3 FlgL|uniref:Flagellar hook-associated protein 3 n=1 Tax=Candidatus Auribacter fodinae TaxID=2093366 RepID=A0A3A4R9S1_9BACT|nr:MAG: flagellar hook-associated protein 3 [Candidatus Auribacter fodinae]
MFDRITNPMLINRNLMYIGKNMQNLQKTQEQISSGKMFRLPSDNPINATQSMGLKNDVKRTEQYKHNIVNGVSFLENTSSVLSQIEDVLLEIKNIAQNAASEITTSAERTAFGFEVNQLLEELLLSSNSKFNGKFIFGGTETLSGTRANSAPFNAVMSGNVIASVTQNPDGIGGEIKRLAGEGKAVIINVNGDDVFQPNGENGTHDIFQTVIRLRENLNANDSASIQDRIKELDREFEQVVSQNTLAGAKVNRLELMSDQLDDLQIIQKERLSELEDTDYAEAIMRLQSQETALQATLAASSRILSQSLLDYI